MNISPCLTGCQRSRLSNAEVPMRFSSSSLDVSRVKPAASIASGSALMTYHISDLPELPSNRCAMLSSGCT